MWDKADLPLYQQHLSSLFQVQFDTWDEPENLPILAAIIPKVFTLAESLAVGSKEIKKPSYKIKKSEEVRKAEFALSRANEKWKSAGRPTETTNELFANKKQAKSNLRKALASENAKNMKYFHASSWRPAWNMVLMMIS